jgi:hypothetical protein
MGHVRAAARLTNRQGFIIFEEYGDHFPGS